MNRGKSVLVSLQCILNRELTADEIKKANILGWAIEWYIIFSNNKCFIKFSKKIKNKKYNLLIKIKFIYFIFFFIFFLIIFFKINQLLINEGFKLYSLFPMILWMVLSLEEVNHAGTRM